MGRSGRKRKQGDRYPSDQLKQQGEGIPGAHWQRIRTHAVKFGLDQRIVTEISRLSMLRELNDKQAETAFRVGDIHRRYHRLKALRVVPKSPSYEVGIIGSADLAEERMSDEQLANHEAELKRAETIWLKVSGFLNLFEGSMRGAIYDLCIHDKTIKPPIRLRDVREMLDAIGDRLDDRRSGPRLFPRLRFVLRGTTAVPQRITPVIPWQKDAQLSALEAVIRRLRTDLGDDQIGQVKQTWLALVDRYRFRATKR